MQSLPNNEEKQKLFGGFLDFKRMTDGDIKQIAENADTLIEII